MASDCSMTEFTSDSQNFRLQLSEGSTIEDTQDLVATNKTKDKDDIIIISDSSCCSSPEYNDKSKQRTNSNKNDKGKYQRLCFWEVSSSDSEEDKSNLPSKWVVKSDNKSLDRKCINRTVLQINKVSSDETASNDDITHDRNVKDQINKYYDKESYKMVFPEKRMTDSKIREKYNFKTNKVIASNCDVYSGDSANGSSGTNKFSAYYSPQQDKTGKIKLTKRDTHKILKNIKSTQLVYNSPREEKQINVIIDESTDEDVMHPAISPGYDKKVKHKLNESPDVIDTSLKGNIAHSKMEILRQYNKYLEILKKGDPYNSLSEKKKRQIAEWLMTNSPDSLSDSSCSNVPLSVRNSRDSGNSSLERLELNYETPNNRERINKAQTDKKKKTVVNSDKMISSLTHRATIDKHCKNFDNNISEFYTPNRPKYLPKMPDKKVSSSTVNTPEHTGKMNDCADILDKLYGNSWRDKANVLLPTTEPRKTSNQATSRIVQTER